MNSKPNQHDELSQLDTDFLVQLTDLAQTIQPAPTFKVNLKAELLQAHPSNSSQPQYKGTNFMNFAFPPLNRRRASLIVCASLAVAVAFMVPNLTSGRATRWLAALFNSTLASKVNAQTIAQAIATGQVTITSDIQEYDKTTQEVRAVGNASFVYPEGQIQAKADEIQYVPTAQQVILLGNVQISQRGENLQGTQATCSLEQKQCSIVQE